MRKPSLWYPAHDGWESRVQSIERSALDSARGKLRVEIHLARRL